MLNVAATTVSRLRDLTTSSLRTGTPSPSLLHLSTYRTALPPSLLFTSFFPHLATRLADGDDTASLRSHARDGSTLDLSNPLATANQLGRRTARSFLFLTSTMSPLGLLRQEIAGRRRALQTARDDLAARIGSLTLEPPAPSATDR